MPPKSVFLSHTSEFERYPLGRSFIDAAVNAVNAAGHQATDMRNLPARDEDPASVVVQRVKQHDIYVGIVGFRYGSPVPDRPELSYTELEFQAATDAHLPRLIFMVAEDANVPPAFVLDVDHGKRQLDFRERLMGLHLTIRSFRSLAELEVQIERALRELEARPEQAVDAKGELLVTWGLHEAGFSQPEFLVFFPGFHGWCPLVLQNATCDIVHVTGIQLKTSLYHDVLEGNTVLGTERLTECPLHFETAEDDAETGLSWKPVGVDAWAIDIPFSLRPHGELILPGMCVAFNDTDDSTAGSEVRKLFGDATLKVEYRVTVIADRPPTQTTLLAPLRVLGGLDDEGDGGIGLLLEKLAPGNESEKERLRKLYQRERQADYSTRGAIAQRLNQMAQRKSLDRAERAVAVGATDPGAHYELGLALLGAEREGEALRALDRALELGLDNVDVRFWRSQTLRVLLRMDEALTEIDRALATSPDDPRLHEQRGRILMDLGRHQEACAAFNSAIQLGPESATAHYGLGLALWSNDADAEALTAFERSLMIDDDRAEAHVGRANVLATLGRDQEAVAALRKALIRGFCDLEALRLSEALLGDDGRRELRQLLDSWGLLDQYDAPTDTPGMTVEDLKIDSGPLPGKE